MEEREIRDFASNLIGQTYEHIYLNSPLFSTIYHLVTTFGLIKTIRLYMDRNIYGPNHWFFTLLTGMYARLLQKKKKPSKYEFFP